MLNKDEIEEIIELKKDVETWWSMGNAIDAGNTIAKIEEIKKNAKLRK